MAKIRTELYGTHTKEAARNGAEVWNSSVVHLGRNQWFLYDLASILFSLRAVYLDGKNPKKYPMAEFGILIAQKELTRARERILPLSILPGDSWIISNLRIIDDSFPVTELMDKGGVEVTRAVIFSLLALSKNNSEGFGIHGHTRELLELAKGHMKKCVQDDLLQNTIEDEDLYFYPKIRLHHRP